jgi:hypothetical protein
MAHVMPQVALHRIIRDGMSIVKANISLLDDIFQYYTSEDMAADYGQSYIDEIKVWLTKTKIPVVQAWHLNMQQVPQIGIQLATEQEDEGKAAIGDHWDEGEEGNVGVGVFNVNLDIIIMGTKNTDEVLWLYYIVNYILFKRKRHAEALGLQLHTFMATDYNKDMVRMPENVYSRIIRFRTTVQNFWSSEPYLNLDDLEVGITYESTSEDEEDITTLVELDLDE